MTFGADGWNAGREARFDKLEGGLGGNGEAVRKEGDCDPVLESAPLLNTAESAGRDFMRVAAGRVRRTAWGLEEGVDGLVGGTG